MSVKQNTNVLLTILVVAVSDLRKLLHALNFFIHALYDTHCCFWILGYPLNAGQLEYDYRDSKCPKGPYLAAPLQKPETLMLQSVPP